MKNSIPNSTSPCDVALRKKVFIQVVASFALEQQEGDKLSKILEMEYINGEISLEKANRILSGQEPEETQRLRKKAKALSEQGQTWRNL